MDLTDFSKGQSWAIVPGHFETLVRRFRSEWKDLTSGAMSKDLSEKLSAAQRIAASNAPYSTQDGIAILPVVGPLTKRSTFWSKLFGASSYEDIRAGFMAAIDDVEIRGIVLDVDSPGGVVNGVDALSEVIYNARDKKPVVAYANGLMASAAYWVGSAAEAVIGSTTAEVGSIGVLMVHQDFSRYEDRLGVNTTYLTAGKYKAIGNDSEPLSLEAREVFQAELDKIYSIFVGTVARNREETADVVRSDMADGRIFIGGDAVEAGLIDSVGSIEDAVSMAKAMINENGEKTVYFIPRGANIKAEPEKLIIMEDNKMASKTELKISDLTADTLREQNPDLVKAIEDAAKKETAADMQKVVDDTFEEADENFGRVLALAKLHFGAEAGEKFQKIVDSGVTPDQYEAISTLNPPPKASKEEEKREEMLKAINDAGNIEVSTGGNAPEGKDFTTLVKDRMAQTGCKYVDAMIEIRNQYPEKHEEYIKSVNN